jgi:hypothetical protein
LATFEEHITQAKSNLEYLSKINFNINERWDWQVTVCFYSAVHLMNAHIIVKTKKNYLMHKQVDTVLNPFSQFSLSKLDEDTYTSYVSLSNLSRRSRYLSNENVIKNDDDIKSGCFTYSKHFKKAISHLEIIINYMVKNHKTEINKIDLKCDDLSHLKLKNFNIKN